MFFKRKSHKKINNEEPEDVITDELSDTESVITIDNELIKLRKQIINTLVESIHKVSIIQITTDKLPSPQEYYEYFDNIFMDKKYYIRERSTISYEYQIMYDKFSIKNIVYDFKININKSHPYVKRYNILKKGGYRLYNYDRLSDNEIDENINRSKPLYDYVMGVNGKTNYHVKLLDIIDKILIKSDNMSILNQQKNEFTEELSQYIDTINNIYNIIINIGQETEGIITKSMYEKIKEILITIYNDFSKIFEVYKDMDKNIKISKNNTIDDILSDELEIIRNISKDSINKKLKNE
ncbi:hypothetical protein FPHOBKDP_00065 [Listeria phage LPJP1]|nr:hypothetical protein FPHOBKDP_00065 [Listeria phage LPJP1]